MKKSSKKNVVKVVELPRKYKTILKVLCIIIGVCLFLTYGIMGGFESLLYGFKEATSVLGYIIVIIIIGFIIAIFFSSPYTVEKKTDYYYNGSTYDVKETTTYISKTKQQKIKDNESLRKTSSISSYAILFVLGLFLLLVVLAILDFLLPVIIGIILIVLFYYLCQFMVLKMLNC